MRSFLRNIALAAFALGASHANALPIAEIQVGAGVTEVQLQGVPLLRDAPAIQRHRQNPRRFNGCKSHATDVGN